jgi:hypothetical protein
MKNYPEFRDLAVQLTKPNPNPNTKTKANEEEVQAPAEKLEETTPSVSIKQPRKGNPKWLYVVVGSVAITAILLIILAVVYLIKERG